MADAGFAISPTPIQAQVAEPRSMDVRKLAFPTVLLLVGIIWILLLLSILKLNDHRFIYTLDDPYISLALSDQIRHGNYGMNAGIPSAPSSSILFPFLLAAASGTAIHPYLPLIFNTLALFFTLVIVWRFLLHLRLAEDRFGQVALAILVFLLAISTNLIGVVFCGLEHSLHIMVTAACICGLALFLDEGKVPVWLPVVIFISPLLRYEGIPLSVAALIALAIRGRWRAALTTFALIVLCVGGFSVFLVSMKLPPLANSIISKSYVAANGLGAKESNNFLLSVVFNIVYQSRFFRIGFALLVIAIAAGVRCCRELRANSWHWTSQALMAFALICLAGGHLSGGAIGWLDRYEDYAMLGSAMLGIYLMQGKIRSGLADRKRRLIYSCATAAALLLLCSHYVSSLRMIPIAANNVYEQQFQMHRFINDYYRGSVAVNDLGLVSYHNPNFVLDLGGLASREGRVLRMTHSTPEQYASIANKYGVHLVIIFDSWFRNKIPASWAKVASMDLSREAVSCPESEVQFYATDPYTASALREELRSFKVSLPSGVNLRIYGAGPVPSH